jgi:hypothetical protein
MHNTHYASLEERTCPQENVLNTWFYVSALFGWEVELDVKKAGRITPVPSVIFTQVTKVLEVRIPW